MTNSSFEEGDGNLVVDSTLDWASASLGIDCVSASKVGCAIDKPTGQNDDSMGNGTKEDDAVPSVVSGSIPNNKSDLLRFYAATTKGLTGKDFLHLAWERVQEPSGTTNMDFEFNQSTTLSSNGITPVRTAGDILIKYDLAQGGNNPILGRHVWITTAGAGSLCEAANKTPCWAKVQSFNATQANGAVNAVDVVDPINPGTPRTLSARTFGEASINLTDTVFAGTPDCVAFGSAYLKSRSADSFTAAVKDFIAPVPITVTNCGTINIHKQDDAAVALAGAVFTLHKDEAPTGGSRGVADTAVVPPKTCTTNASGNCSMANVPFGQYWVVETTTPAGHSTAPDQNVIVSPATSPVNLLFINPRQPASIKLHKQDDIGAALEGAMFTLYENSAPTTAPRGAGDTITSYTCTSLANGDCTISGILDPGDYWIVETVVPAGHTGAAERPVTIALGENLVISEPFVNPRLPASVEVMKIDDLGAPLAGAVFTLFTDAAPTGGSLGVGDIATTFTCTSGSDGLCTISNILPPGDYWVVETTTPPGHETAPDQSINLSLAQNLDLTGTPFVNPRKPATIKLKKEDDTQAPLAGAVFTLFTDNAPVGGAKGAEDTITGFTCTSGVDGLCTISSILPPGSYWIVETTVPAGHTKAADRLVTVALDQVLDISGQPFVNPRQSASVVLSKQDDTGAPLGGAVFTLYTDNAPTGGSRGAGDTITLFTCTSQANGDCTISNILPPGNYWLVETATPVGYETAPERAISLSLNQALDLRADPFVDPRIPATVTLHKQDDTGAPLAGAEFTLYTNDVPTSAPRGVEDDLTAFTCITNAQGDCTITDVLPAGNYWVVETTVPTGYVGAADRAVTLALDQDLDISSQPFVNTRKFTVVVLVCKESNNTLHPSTVTLDGADTTSLASANVPDAICDTGGARYTGRLPGDHPGKVNIP